MRIAHLILAHHNPAQLKRLINTLAHANADVYLHLDAKAAKEQFRDLKKLPNVYFIKNNVKVYWGTFSIVQATINGFEEILESGREYGYINLISGQDYPLKSADEFYNFLSENPGKAYMNSLVAETHWLEALPRVSMYHLNNYTFPGRYMVQKALNAITPTRSLPDNMILVGRSQWFTASAACVKYIIDYWESHPALRRFIKLTWAPDEFLFQTILYNSPLKDSMVDEDLRYIDWSNGGESPKVLTMIDAEKMLSSGKFFARKLDMMRDSAVFDYIDNHR